MLQDLGYRAIARNETLVESASSGFKFLIHIHPDGWLQFVLSAVNGFGFTLDDANEFNRKYRFVKVYLDKENDIVLGFEFPLRGDEKSSLTEGITLWDDLVGILLTSLRGKVELDEVGHRETSTLEIAEDTKAE
jgi:hypothetical protein